MSKTGVMVIAALSIGLGTGDASAGEQDEIGNGIEPWANLEANLGDNTSAEYLGEYIQDDGQKCDAFVKKTIKKVGAGRTVKMYDAEGHPKAVQDGDQWTVQSGDLGWYCDQWRARVYVLQLNAYLGTASRAQMVVDSGYSDEDKKNIRGGGDELRRLSAKCLELVKKATDRGADPATKLKNYADKSTLGEMPARCEVIVQEAAIRDGLWKELSKEFEKPFSDAGAKGDKLAWLVERGPGIDGWYVKGCKEPKNVKALLKASVWFQWFYPPEGGHMIRRIQFKGNKQVKITEKHYWTEAKAYKGCK